MSITIKPRPNAGTRVGQRRLWLTAIQAEAARIGTLAREARKAARGEVQRLKIAYLTANGLIPESDGPMDKPVPAKPVPVRTIWFLATETDMVRFEFHAGAQGRADVFAVTRSSRVGPWPKYPAAPEQLTREEARAEYKRLLATHSPW